MCPDLVYYRFLISHFLADIISSHSEVENATNEDFGTALESERQMEWPVWAPIECLITETSHIGFLQRVMDRTSVSCHRDRANPLYVKENEDEVDNSVSLSLVFLINGCRIISRWTFRCSPFL